MKKFLIVLILLLFGLMCAAAGCTTPPSPGDVDVDLTQMSDFLANAKIDNIMNNPKIYVGKTIKMRGEYYVTYSTSTSTYYHSVVIWDATACCPKGFEFVLNGDYSYPADYPAKDTKIEVTGVFKSYAEGKQTYYHLETDEIVILP